MSAGTFLDAQDLGVLVAVGPGGIGDGALDLAAAAAARLGTGVEVLHVVHSLVTVPAGADQLAGIERALARVGRAVLTDAAARLRERLGDGSTVSPEVVIGPVSRTLVERGAGRALVVVERREPGVLERLLTASVSSAVAAHADGPVVVVPPHWTAAADDARPVTVGVGRPEQAPREVPAALSYAAGVGARCVALHAAWLPEAYQDTLFVDHPRRLWVDEAHAALRVALEPLRAAHPGADLDDVVRWARPVDALVDASRMSQALVLARREPDHLMGTRLGPVTRTLLHHAECPVLVVDRVEERPTLGP